MHSSLLPSSKNIEHTVTTANERYSSPYGKILSSVQEALEKIKNLEGVAITGGCFDIPHVLHAEALRIASNIYQHLIILLATDEHIQERKGKPPSIPYAKRAMHLAHYPYIEYITPLHTTNFEECLCFPNATYLRSITSGAWILQEREQFRARLAAIGSSMVIMDEIGLPLREEEIVARITAYEQQKNEGQAFGNTWIKHNMHSSSTHPHPPHA